MKTIKGRKAHLYWPHRTKSGNRVVVSAACGRNIDTWSPNMLPGGNTERCFMHAKNRCKQCERFL